MKTTQGLLFSAVLAVVAATNNHVDFKEACWSVVEEMILADPSLVNNSQLQCGQKYREHTLPALPVNISLPICMKRWPGWSMSETKVLSTWIGPMVGFLLPALGFTMTIPRNYRVPRGNKLFNRSLILSSLWLIVAFVLLILDTFLWIIIVFGLAGPLMVGALDEGLKDWRILRSIEKEEQDSPDGYTRAQASYALALILVGTFMPREDPQKCCDHDLVDDVVLQICNAPDVGKTREKLRQLLSQQIPYGVQIGAPVMFYVGSYAYSLFDADIRLGNNDTAHAIAFGLWYALIVLTATTCRCLIGLNNPFTIESIFDTPHGDEKIEKDWKRYFSPYAGQHRSVWIYDRPKCARSWARPEIVDLDGTPKPIHPQVKKILESRSLDVLACLGSMANIAVICSLAFTISYYTPRIGFGCRATTIFLHGSSQIALVVCWFYHNQEEQRRIELIKWPVYVLSGLLVVFSIFIGVGGTIMQLLGVYRNCMCGANVAAWRNKSEGIVFLSTDTQQDRDSSALWISLGITGVCYTGFFCMLGYGYFMRMKAKTAEQIEALL